MPVVNGYIRASTNEQDDSLVMQEESIEKEWAHRFVDFDKRLWLDKGVSGSLPLLNRPQGMLMNAALEKGDVVILHKLDRGFRNARDMLVMLEAWQAKGVRMISLDLNIDTGTPMGKFFITLIAAFAELERSRICERTRDVARSKKARGLCCGQVPWGYRKVKKGKDKVLVPCEYTRTMAKKIVELVDAHKMSYLEIHWHFRRNGILGPHGTPLSRSGIHRYYQLELRLQAIEGLKAQQQASPAPSPSPRGGNTLDP